MEKHLVEKYAKSKSKHLSDLLLIDLLLIDREYTKKSIIGKSIEALSNNRGLLFENLFA